MEDGDAPPPGWIYLTSSLNWPYWFQLTHTFREIYAYTLDLMADKTITKDELRTQNSDCVKELDDLIGMSGLFLVIPLPDIPEICNFWGFAPR